VVGSALASLLQEALVSTVCRASAPCAYCRALARPQPLSDLRDLALGRAVASVRRSEDYSVQQAAWLGWMAMESCEPDFVRVLECYLERHHGR
jgi:hypothetical protein